MSTEKPGLTLNPMAVSGPKDVRLTVLQEESAHPLVDTTGEDWLMTIPHLLLREVVTFCLLISFYAGVSYLWDAPLLGLADPSRTPNPAKAPWYFLGLQEMLHYYPPLVSGIVIPGLVLLFLVVVPYFDINIHRTPFLSGGHFARHLLVVWLLSIVACWAFYVSSEAGPVWPLIGTTAFMVIMMSLPLVLGRRGGLGRWLSTRSLPFWIFGWFVLSAVALTVIGTFFRGPGWSFVLPWEVGIYD